MAGVDIPYTAKTLASIFAFGNGPEDGDKPYGGPLFAGLYQANHDDRLGVSRSGGTWCSP